jgi:hypothetical protein
MGRRLDDTHRKAGREDATGMRVPRRYRMTDPETSRHIEVEGGDQTVADADVSASAQPGGTARASLRAASGHIEPGSRARLVDAVMDLPEVRESSRLKAAIPLGDSESLERLRERADEVTTRPAGSTALVDATVPPPDEPERRPEKPDSPSPTGH